MKLCIRFNDIFTSAKDEMLIEKSIVITGFSTLYTAVTENTVCADSTFPSKTYPKILRNIDVLDTNVSKEKIVPSKYLCCRIDLTSFLKSKMLILSYDDTISQHVSYLLAKEISFANGFSQAYIFITCMPDMISFINLTLSSVRSAVLNLKTDVLFPKNTKKEILLGISNKIQDFRRIQTKENR